MDGIAESPMEIVNLPLNVKVGFYGDSGPPAIKMAVAGALITVQQ